MRNLVQQPDSAWWDDKATTDKTETRDDIFARAFAETVTQLEKEYGKDSAKVAHLGRTARRDLPQSDTWQIWHWSHRSHSSTADRSLQAAANPLSTRQVGR